MHIDEAPLLHSAPKPMKGPAEVFLMQLPLWGDVFSTHAGYTPFITRSLYLNNFYSSDHILCFDAGAIMPTTAVKNAW